jgi:hypothetical protein
MTIRERIDHERSDGEMLYGQNAPKAGAKHYAIAAQLTRLLALVEAVGKMRNKYPGEQGSCCIVCGQDLCWHTTEGCPWFQMQDAYKALDTAGDLDKPQNPPLNINGGPLKPLVRQFIDGKDVTPFDSECEPKRPKPQQKEKQ